MSVRQTFIRNLKLVLVILVGYLAHVSIMPYIHFGDVSPSMLMQSSG